MTWNPTQSLPGNYEWGYASRSQNKAAGYPVKQHVVVVKGDKPRMLCSAGLAIRGNGGGEYCTRCVALVREQLSDE